LSPKFIIGYTDTETVKLDFDNTSFQKVKHWALLTLKHFDLGGFLILESSENCYHVIFDRTVSWSENMSIVAWVSLLSHNKKLRNWLTMQCIKKESTLRISPKGKKPSPRIVFRHGEQDHEIQSYLEYRNSIKTITHRFQEKMN
jgi:hypothetical protein